MLRWFGHMTKMATMPINGNNCLKKIFSRNQEPMSSGGQPGRMAIYGKSPLKHLIILQIQNASEH